MTNAEARFNKSHIRQVYACLAVTCHLHFWQNDRDLLRATVVTRGWNGYRNKSQHRKSTLEKKILPPFPKTDAVSPYFIKSSREGVGRKRVEREGEVQTVNTNIAVSAGPKQVTKEFRLPCSCLLTGGVKVTRSASRGTSRWFTFNRNVKYNL